MKKIIASLSLVLVACFAVVGLSACKKVTKKDIVGTWTLIAYEEYDKEGNLLRKDDYANEATEPYCRFNADGTYEYYSGNSFEPSGVTWTFKKGKFEAKTAAGEILPIEIKKGKLILKSEGYSYIAVYTLKKMK